MLWSAALFALASAWFNVFAKANGSCFRPKWSSERDSFLWLLLTFICMVWNQKTGCCGRSLSHL
jgi:hypothetical protein